MTEIDLNDLALTYITAYGAPMVAGILLLGALGLPLPGTLVVIASGAFVRQDFLNIYTTPLWALAGAVAGDSIIYGLGRFARLWIEKRFGDSAGWQKAQDFFERRGGIAIYLTRWLVTPLAVPTNLVAGSSGYSFAKFLLFDVAGEITWILLYGGLGYAFGSQWELISDFISNFSGLILGVVVLGAGVYLLVRFRKKPAAEPTAEPEALPGN
jgi:membrane protein DedA with SNARE-associated domain